MEGIDWVNVAVLGAGSVLLLLAALWAFPRRTCGPEGGAEGPFIALRNGFVAGPYPLAEIELLGLMGFHQ